MRRNDPGMRVLRVAAWLCVAAAAGDAAVTAYEISRRHVAEASNYLLCCAVLLLQAWTMRGMRRSRSRLLDGLEEVEAMKSYLRAAPIGLALGTAQPLDAGGDAAGKA